MPKKESPLQQLSLYLPEGAFEEVAAYLTEYKVHLTVTRERRTVLGDYRNSHANKNHRISVNGNLNKYSFIITLLHELGHLVAHKERVWGLKAVEVQAHWFAAAFLMPREDIIGQYLCALIPVNRSGGFFDEYKQVVMTGQHFQK